MILFQKGVVYSVEKVKLEKIMGIQGKPIPPEYKKA
ncbi:MAG: hypothetical protein ACI9FJ_002566, partial [Alteromonadaceae bacterium]